MNTSSTSAGRKDKSDWVSAAGRASLKESEVACSSGAPSAGTPRPDLLMKLCRISAPALLPVSSLKNSYKGSQYLTNMASILIIRSLEFTVDSDFI